jgi:gamma-glutamyltranspeptidase/glutathione hydrolase
MPALAETLERIAEEGADYFYTGAWAQKFVEEANRRGYGVTMKDLAAYQPRWVEPVRFTYRGHEILGSSPPDTGGLVVGYNLNILEQFDLETLGHYTESADTLEIMSRALGRVRDETRFAIVDPLNFRIPSDLWLSKEYGKMGAEYVRQTMPMPGVDLSRQEAPTTARRDLPDRKVHSTTTEDAYLASNHNVIVDAQGNWITLLSTSHAGAPGIFIDGASATGSAARAHTAGPGRRLVLPITAIMIVKEGVPWLAMGTPGSPPQPVTEVLVNILDFGMDPMEAAKAPRFWAFRNQEREVAIESRISDSVRQGMKSRGIKIKDLGIYNWHTGSMQIVWRDSESGQLHGVTDPRRLCAAAGY